MQVGGKLRTIYIQREGDKELLLCWSFKQEDFLQKILEYSVQFKDMP